MPSLWSPSKFIVILYVCVFSTNAFANHGTCCLNGGVCYDTMNAETCQIWGGVWFPNLTCDEVTCETNCGGDCSPGEIQDCFGNCVPITWIGDGICNNGCSGCPQWDTEYIYLNCEEFGYDGGDCPPEDLPQNEGACCIGALDDCDGRYCENKLYADCLDAGGQYLGENTICVDQACSCPPGQTADCNGNCFPLYYLNDGICHEGHWYPENGENSHEYQLNLGCIELACDYGDCTGICSGACCVGQNCFEGLAFNQCAEQGGTFLGGGETCELVDCTNYLIPQSIGVELSGNENPIAGEIAHSVAASDGVFAQALFDATNSSTGQSVTACNIYRGNSTLSETLYFSNSSNGPTSVDTDGARIVLSQGTRLRVYVDNGSAFTLEQELASGFEISNVSISDNVIFVTTSPPSPGGAVNWFKRKGNVWVEQIPILDGTFATNVVVDDDVMAVLRYDSVMMYSYDGVSWNADDIADDLGDEVGTEGTWQDVDIDGDYVVLGETTNYYNGIIAQARVFKKTSGTWYLDANLIPVDTRPDDEYGYSVSIEDGVACISGRLNDSSVLNGGMIAVFKKSNGNWIYTNRIIPYNSVPTMGFGAQIATDGVSVIATWEEATEDIWTEGSRGSQFVALPEFEWSNPEGGAIDSLSNWVPSLPNVGDSASISIPSQFEISTSGSLPFTNLVVGPSKPTLGLSETTATLQGSLLVEGTSNYIGDLDLSQGQLRIEGNATIGTEHRPGALSIQAGASVVVEGDFSLSRNSQLHIELALSAPIPLQLESAVALQGSLLVSCSIEGFNPEVGDEWVLFTTAQTLVQENIFSVVVLPGIGNEKYFELQYVPLLSGTQLVATVQQVDNLYDLEGADSVNISGIATDVVVADLGSLGGVADGFDDIALSVSGSPGNVYIFLNDGNGNISTQIAYTAGNNPTSIDAGDIDNDGTNDLVVTNGGDDAFFLLLNDGEGASDMSQQLPIATGDLPVDAVFTNIDDDGDNDIVVACYGEEDILPDGTVPGELRFYEVSPSLRMSISLAGIFAFEKPGKIDPGDVNNDKDFILSVSLNTAGKVALMRRASAAKGFDWGVVQRIAVGANPSYIRTGDLDNDGDPDAIVANEGSNTISILQMGVTNVYENELVIEVGDAPSSVELLDYDGDEDLDLAVIASDGSSQRVVYIYRNDTSLNGGQNITFALEQILDEGANPILLGSGEMDGDAAEDLVSILSATGFRGSNDTTLSIKSVPSTACLGDFDSNNTIDVNDLLVLIGYWGSAAGDLTDDGATDVLDILVLIGAWGPCG